MYYKLPVKERIELMKSYRKANPDMSYQDMVNDYNTSYQKFGDGGKKDNSNNLIATPTYYGGKEQNMSQYPMTTAQKLIHKSKAASEADRQYNFGKALTNVASFVPGPIGYVANAVSGVMDIAEGNEVTGTMQLIPNRVSRTVSGFNNLMTSKDLYDYGTTPEKTYSSYLPYYTDEYKRELFKPQSLTKQKYGGIQQFDNGGKKQQTRTDIYTDKAAFDKAYKAEIDSINVRKKYDQTFTPGYKTRPLTKEEKEEYKDEQTGLYPNVVEYIPGQRYFGHFKKPVVHNVYQEPEKEPKPFVKKWTDKVAYDNAVKAEMDSANRYNEYINKVKQYQKEGLELKRASFVDKATLNFMNDPAFANSIYSKPIREEYYGNPTKSGNVTSQATALVYKKPVVHNVYEPVMTKLIQPSQDTVRHWNFNGPNPVMEYYDKSGKLINKEFYTNAGPGGKRIQPLNK